MLKGFWRISQKNRIAYILDAKNDSHFSSKVHFETPGIKGKEGVIQYRVGIGAGTRRSSAFKLVTLYGIWKFGSRKGISFEVAYGGGVFRPIAFGTRYYLTKQNKVVFHSGNKHGLLGLCIVL